MLSKNNHLEKQRHQAPWVKHYTLRKLNIGVCSVLVGLSIGGVRAHADQLKSNQHTNSSENTYGVQTTNIQASQVTLGQHSDASVTPQSQSADSADHQNADQHQSSTATTDQAVALVATAADNQTTTQDQVNVSDWDYQRQSDGILLNGFHGTVQNGKIIVPNTYDFTQAGVITAGQKVYIDAYFRRNTGNQGHDIHDQFGSQATEFMISHNGNGKVYAQGDWGDAFNGVSYKLMDLTNLDVSEVTSMSQMFAWAQCERIIGLDGWDTSHVGNMGTMFSHCLNLTSIGDLSHWQVGNVTYMADMFALSPKLTTVGHLNNWDVRKVNSMVEMFWGCNSLQDVGDLSAWRLDSVQNTRQMFEGCFVLTNLGNLDHWGMAQDTDMQRMFNDCRKLTNIGSLDQWQTGKVTNMQSMFNDCYGLTNIGTLANWQTGNVTNMENMFHNTTSLKQLNLTNWDTGKVTSLKLFIACEDDNKTLTSIGDLSHWNVGNVTKLESAFSHRNKITSLGDLGNWDVSKVTDMQTTFYRMFDLQSLGNLGNWKTSQLTNLVMTFMDDHSLSSLGDIYKWNVANVTAANAAFCRTGMTAIDIHGWNLAYDTNTQWMFAYGFKPTVIDMRSVTLPTSTTFTILSFYGDQPMVVYSDQGSQLFKLNNDSYVANDWVGPYSDKGYFHNVAIDVVGRHNTNYLTLTNHANNEKIATIPVDFVYASPEQLVSTLKAATAKTAINQLVQNKYGRTVSVANDNFDSNGSLNHNYQPADTNPVALVAGTGSVYPVDLQGPKYTHQIIYVVGTKKVGETKLIGHLDIDNKAIISVQTLNDKIATGMPNGYYLTSKPFTAATTINSTTPTPIKVQVSNKAQLTIIYQTTDGQQITTQTVDGKVGEKKTLTFTAPNGYRLAEGQVKSQAFTFQKTNEPVVVHITAIPVSASVDIKYETADGRVIKTDPVDGYVGDQVHLNFVVPAGYEVVGQLPADTYTFTGNDQPIVIEVQATQPAPDHGEHGQPSTPIENDQHDHKPSTTPADQEDHHGSTVSQLTSGQVTATAHVTNNKQTEKLPQTGNHRGFALVALGGAALMLALGLAGRARRHE